MRNHGDYNWQPPMNTQPCKVDGCDGTARKYGYCIKHCDRFRRHGDPLAGRKPYGTVPEFLAAAAKHDGDACLIWPWKESRIDQGYARARTSTAASWALIAPSAFLRTARHLSRAQKLRTRAEMDI